MLFSSLHTHNTFCDGKNTIEEMIEEAIKLGFSSIGISSHAYTGYSFDECGIKKDRIEDYFKAVEEAKEKYKNKIDVFLGMEEESRIEGEKRPSLDSRLDYAIGSVLSTNPKSCGIPWLYIILPTVVSIFLCFNSPSISLYILTNIFACNPKSPF